MSSAPPLWENTDEVNFPFEKLLTRFALTIFLLVSALVGYLAWSGKAYFGNKIHDNEQKLVALHLQSQSKLVSDFLWTALAWDEAVLNIEKNFNPEWASENIGGYLYDIKAFDYAFIYSPYDALIFAAKDGQAQSAADFRNVNSIVKPLINNLRAKEYIYNAKENSSGELKTLTPLIYNQSYARMNEAPYLVTAILLTGEQKSQKPLSGRHAIIVTFNKIDNNYLKSLSSPAPLPGLVIGTDCSKRSEDLACVEVKDLAQVPVFSISWKSGSSGDPLTARTIVTIGVSVGLFALLSLLFLMWGWALNRKYLVNRERVTFLAFHDSLTTLPNRELAFDRLRQMIAGLRREPKWVAVHALDLDMFKKINDTYGHSAGDSVLVATAKRLQRLCRETDTVARLGGDEFLIFQSIDSPTQAVTLAERIIRELSEPIELPNGSIRGSCSVGTVTTNDANVPIETLVRQADAALYVTKTQGGNGVTFFDENIDLKLRRDRLIRDKLASAIAKEEINVFYQKIIDQTGACVSVEALARWENHIGLDVLPGDFLRIADESHQAVDLGCLILEKIAKDSHAFSGIRICINVSLSQLRSSIFEEALKNSIEQNFSKSCTYEIEISEKTWLPDSQDLIAIIHRLRQVGYTFALDDFGTGYSRLGNIRSFDFDRIKIDQSLVMDISSDTRIKSAVAAMVHLGSALMVEVVAVGVENQIVFNMLRKMGGCLFQGYLVGRPMPSSQIAALIAPLEIERSA